jgi:hypothetical protein
VLVAIALVYAPAAMGWTWPADGPVLRPFALGNDPYAAGQHRGIDIGAVPGTAVRAAASGTVTFAGAVPAGGRTVTVRTPSGLSVTHLELGTIGVVRGTEVAEGDELGTIGPAEHVHLGVRLASDPHGYLDPLQFLPARTSSPARADPSAAGVVQQEPPGTNEPASVERPVVAVAPKNERPEPALVTQAAAPAVEPKAAPAAQATEPAARSSPVVMPSPAPTPEPVPEPKAEPSASEPSPAQLDVERPGAPDVARSAERPRDSAGAAVRPRSKWTDTRPHLPRSPTAGRPLGRLDSHAPPAFGAAVVRDGPRAEVGGPQQGAPASPAAVRADLALESGRPTHVARSVRGGDDPGTWKLVSGAVLVLLVVAVLAAAAAAYRTRRQSNAWRVSASTATMGCSRRPPRPQRLIHQCVRAGQPAWLVPRARSRSASNRPLPRRRRVPAAVAA